MSKVDAALPVLAFREEILAAVRGSAVTVITAETGAGKSTQVPQFLAGAGYRVVVTQPRRMAARTVAQRVAYEMGTRLGDRVGFRTAEERADSAATEILFVTDGLQLVRELAGSGKTGGQTVLVLDEVHEWNENMEVLVAWTKSRVAAGDDLKVVLMSATLDAERLAAFFGSSTPRIEIPGRLFPVERRSARASELVREACRLANEGRNVLVFQPGKKEIEETTASISSALGAKAVVLPLHGQLEPAEQQRCFQPPPVGKVKVVVATNVAQTSVTIPDIDAVCDSGIERRVELRDGIEGLYLGAISQADCLQRAGRAGRCKPGIYILCADAGLEDRPAFPVPQILRQRLDQMTLRLASQGFDATAMEFFHQPAREVLADARRALVALGAMTAEGQVTKTGRRMARLPVSVQFARMLVEAERLHVVEEVATVAACLEAGDIRAKGDAWRSLTQERSSDLLAVLDVFTAAKAMKGGAGKSKAEALRDAGVFVKDFFRAEEIRRKLLDEGKRRGLDEGERKFPSVEAKRSAVLRACVAGMVDHLYRAEYGGYRNGSAVERELARESVVAGRPDWLVGLPKDIEIVNRRGRKVTLRLVSMASAVEPQWLLEVAPQLAETRPGLNPRFAPAKDAVVSTTETFFNGQKLGSQEVEDSDRSDAAEIFCTWLSAQAAAPGTHLDGVLRANSERQSRARALNLRAGETVFLVFSGEEIRAHFRTALSGAKCVVGVDAPERLALPPLDKNQEAAILAACPDSVSVGGRELAVDYQSGTSPRVTLPRDSVETGLVWQIPAQGMRLPGGRVVEVVVPTGYYDSITDADVPRLHAKVREHLNRGAWQTFTSSAPAIPVPDPANPEAAFPELQIVEYGTCAVSGVGLRAFGALGVNGQRWYSSDPEFRAEWHRDWRDAELARLAAADKFEAGREAARARAEVDAAVAAAEAAREALRQATDDGLWHEAVEGEKYSLVERRRYSEALPHEIADLRRWAAETLALVAEVEAAVAVVREQRAAAEREAEAAREAERGEVAAYGVETREQLALARALAARAAKVCTRGGAVALLDGELNAGYGRARRQRAVEDRLGRTEETEVFFSYGRAMDVDAVLAAALRILQEPPPASPTPAAPTATPTPAACPEKPADLSKVDLSQLFGGGRIKKR